jgi:hypothetical protein
MNQELSLDEYLTVNMNRIVLDWYRQLDIH